MATFWIHLSRALGLATLLGVPAALPAEDGPLIRGPFEIEAFTRKISAGGFPNTTANPFKKRAVAAFRLKFHGKVVEVEDQGQVFDQFGEACFLEGNEKPVVLLATTGIWIIHEEQGRAKVTSLVPPQEMAVLQWLDSEAGQPGPQFNIGLRDPGSPPILRGKGSLLIASGQTVFNLKTLTSHHLQLNMHDVIEQLGGYYAGAGFGCRPALMLSPGRTQYLVVGNRSAEGSLHYEYAVIAVDFTRGKAYSLPFDRTATRLVDGYDSPTPEWIDFHFQWTREADGAERLVPRKIAKPYPWTGRIMDSKDYELQPVRPELLAVLGTFLEKRFGAEPVTPEEDPFRRQYRLEGWLLKLWYRAEEQKLVCYLGLSAVVPNTAGKALVEKVGLAFNAELRQGRHQEWFTRFLD